MLNAPSGSKQSATSRAKHIKNLTRSEPGITPAAFLLSSLAQASEAVVDITATGDPITSKLLAFGTAADIDNKHSGTRKIDIVAVAGGLGGEAIRILRVGSEQISWIGHKGVTLSVPTIDATEQGWWIGNGSPIQQICFSEYEGRHGGWLAVRYSGATSILRPLTRRQPVPAGSRHPNNVLRKRFMPSRLDSNQILHLNIEQTGGQQHTDVAFNPWNERQFAVLDVQGQWSVWDIQGKYSKRNLWTIVSVSSGSPSDCEYDQYSTDISDGWGNILWAGDATTLIIAVRNNLLVYTIGSKAERGMGPELGLTDGSDWILNVQRSPVNPTHIFVLTSLYIYWLKVDCQRSQDTGSQVKSSSKVLLARRHHRSQEDSSLTMLLYTKLEGKLVML